MQTSRLIIIVLLTIAMSGCGITPTKTPNPTATSTSSPKQPEPGHPRIGGEISGVLDNTLVTIHVRTLKGREPLWGTRQGNGLWEAVVTDTSSIDYVVTCEADGFISTPNSYTIHLDGLMAYIVEDGQITTKEAVNLDFHFDPVATTTPTK